MMTSADLQTLREWKSWLDGDHPAARAGYPFDEQCSAFRIRDNAVMAADGTDGDLLAVVTFTRGERALRFPPAPGYEADQHAIREAIRSI